MEAALAGDSLPGSGSSSADPADLSDDESFAFDDETAATTPSADTGPADDDDDLESYAFDDEPMAVDAAAEQAGQQSDQRASSREPRQRDPEY